MHDRICCRRLGSARRWIRGGIVTAERDGRTEAAPPHPAMGSAVRLVPHGHRSYVQG